MRGSKPASSEGDEICPFYDPMIAKLIVHGRRHATSAIARLAAMLRRTSMSGRSRPMPAFSAHAAARSGLSRRRGRYRASSPEYRRCLIRHAAARARCAALRGAARSAGQAAQRRPLATCRLAGSTLKHSRIAQSPRRDVDARRRAAIHVEPRSMGDPSAPSRRAATTVSRHRRGGSVLAFARRGPRRGGAAPPATARSSPPCPARSSRWRWRRARR